MVDSLQNTLLTYAFSTTQYTCDYLSNCFDTTSYDSVRMNNKVVLTSLVLNHKTLQNKQKTIFLSWEVRGAKYSVMTSLIKKQFRCQ